MAGPPHNILIVGPSWVGDMVMAQSLFIRLCDSQGPAHIDVVAHAWSLPLLSRMPQVREAIELPVDHGEFGLTQRWQLGRTLRDKRYDRAIVLPLTFKSALIPFFARVPRRTGYRGEHRYGLINDMRRLDESVRRPMALRYAALAAAPGPAQTERPPQPAIRIDETNQRRLIGELRLSVDRPVVGIMPGNEHGPAKAWPAERFGELAARLVGSGYRVWVFGSEKQRAVGEQIRQTAGREVTNLCGRTLLQDAADLIALTATVVTNDSGLMHVSAAVGARVVAIYGSSSPRYTPPLTQNKEVLYLGLDCSPCFERTCPLGHLRCLREIAVDDVFAAVRRSP